MNIEKWRLERFPSTSTCTIHSSVPTKNVVNCLLSVFERIAIVSSSTTKLLFFMVNPATVKPNAFDGLPFFVCLWFFGRHGGCGMQYFEHSYVPDR